VTEQTTVFRSSGLALLGDWHVWKLFFLLDYSTFPSSAVERMHARAAAAGDPDRDVHAAALREKLFGADHPYAADPLTAEDVRRIGARDCARFRERYYKAKGATLIIAGAFDVSEMQREVTDLFGTWDDRAPAAIPDIPDARPASGPSWIGVEDASSSQAHLTVAFATQTDPETDRAARLVLVRVLEDRLRVVREGQGASYGLSVDYLGGGGGGALAVDGMLDPDRAGDAVVAVMEELARLSDPDVDLAEDFVRARRRAVASVLADAAGAADTADELLFVAAHRLDAGYFSALAKAIGATTLDDLRAAIARDLDPARSAIAVTARRDVLDAIATSVGVDPGANLRSDR
jgi:zinc protease